MEPILHLFRLGPKRNKYYFKFPSNAGRSIDCLWHKKTHVKLGHVCNFTCSSEQLLSEHMVENNMRTHSLNMRGWRNNNMVLPGIEK